MRSEAVRRNEMRARQAEVEHLNAMQARARVRSVAAQAAAERDWLAWALTGARWSPAQGLGPAQCPEGKGSVVSSGGWDRIRGSSGRRRALASMRIALRRLAV